MAIQISFCQEFKVDERTQMEKEDPMKIYNLDETSILDLLEMIEVQGVRMNKFEFGNFDKDYKILLLSDKYDSGNLIKTDTLGQFESTYRYYEEEKPYYDYMDKIKIITKDDDTKSELFIKTYAFSSKAQIELKRTNKNSFFNWRNYKNTDWKLNKKIPLILSIKNPNEQEVYQIRKINDINIYVESLDELSNIDSYTDSINFKGIKIFSKGNLNYTTRSLTEPIFFKKGENYSEEKKLLTSRYFSNLGAFKYPRIILEENNDSLSSSIYLLPRDRFSLGFDLDFTHSNIEDFGISFGTNFNIRNICTYVPLF